MRILVLQTTRMGDVLQTSPLVRGIRRMHPDAHIAFMVREMGRAVAERNPDVDEVLVYDEDEVFQALRSQDSDRLVQAYQRAEARIMQIKEGRYDRVYNTTHSIASAMLLKLAEVSDVIGAHLSDDWQFVLRGPWTNYFFTSVFHRDYNDLNLCDITRHFVPDAPSCQELVVDVIEADRQFVRALLAEHGIQPEDFVACFQLGASEENKRWPESQFAALAQLLVEQRRARIVLVGVSTEEPLGQAFEQHAPGVAVPLFGKTNIPQLAALLERSNLLVTNDTGTMHIAAAVKCPILLVSVGYVHFRETGPFGSGHCAIERHRTHLGRMDTAGSGLEERMQVQPRQVLRAIDLMLGNNVRDPVDQVDVDDELAGVDIFMSRFAPDGCLEWYPVPRRAFTSTDLLRIAYRAMWLEHLCGRTDTEREQTSIVRMLPLYESPEDGAVAMWRSDLTGTFERLGELAQRGIDTTHDLLAVLRQSQSMKKAQQIVQTLVDLDEQMRLFGELNPACKPLILISHYERDNLEGADPQRLAETTLRIYEDCLARATLMTRKIDRLRQTWESLHARG